MPTFSCKNCVAPKRHPGCHGTCQEYQTEKAKYEEMKAEHDKQRNISGGIYYQRGKKVYEAMKNRKKGKPYAQ